MSAWQPIETVPDEIKRDGTRFDVWINSRRVADAYYTWLRNGHTSNPLYLCLVCDYVDEGGSQLVDDLSAATHWQPLPEPPST